jgi:hypothetical protein
VIPIIFQLNNCRQNYIIIKLKIIYVITSTGLKIDCLFIWKKSILRSQFSSQISVEKKRYSLLGTYNAGCKFRSHRIGSGTQSNDFWIYIYNAIVVDVLQNRRKYFCFQNAIGYSWRCKILQRWRCNSILMVDTRTQSWDNELQRQRCKKLLRREYVPSLAHF